MVAVACGVMLLVDVRKSSIVGTLVYRGSFSMLGLKSTRTDGIKELTLPLLIKFRSDRRWTEYFLKQRNTDEAGASNPKQTSASRCLQHQIPELSFCAAHIDIRSQICDSPIASSCLSSKNPPK